MKNKKSLTAIISILILTAITFTGCFEFKFINQPDTAEKNSFFDVDIQVETGGGNYGYFFSVMLPIGWTIDDELPFYRNGEHIGTMTYSPEHSEYINYQHPVNDGYYWWVSEGDTILSAFDDYVFDATLRIYTDEKTGNYNLTYALGNSGGYYGNEYLTEVSYDNWISIDVQESMLVTNTNDSGPGSLRYAIQNVAVGGAITFDLPRNSIITLESELLVPYKVNIMGPGENELTISGQNNCRVFKTSCPKDKPATISGITVANGSTWSYGSYTNGGGIYAEGDLILKNVIIKDNKTSTAGGGLFVARGPYPDYEPGYVELHNLKILNNESTISGGGLCFDRYSTIHFDGVTITNNHANQNGGGLYADRYCQFVFNNPFNDYSSSSIYLNTAEENGFDIATSNNQDEYFIKLDTFSVMNPVDVFAYPHEKFQFDINHSKIELASQDLYVNPEGSNDNSGLTEDEPLESITMAMIKLMQDTTGRTIHLANGTYTDDANYEMFPLLPLNNVSIVGEDKSLCILDGQGSIEILNVNEIDSVRIRNLTFQNALGVALEANICNVLLDNIVVKQTNGIDSYSTGVSLNNVTGQVSNIKVLNNTTGRGGGMHIFNSQIDITNSEFSHNQGQYGGGVNIEDSDVSIHDCMITDNVSSNSGGGLYSGYSNIELSNVVISRNSCNDYGGGLHLRTSTSNLSNTSIYNNETGNNGGGIYINSGTLNLDPQNRSSIYLNEAKMGKEVAAVGVNQISLTLDTCTVKQPDAIIVHPHNIFTFDILHGIYDQYAQDIFVSPDGDDANTGISPDDPVQTLYTANLKALPDSNNPLTIHLAPGVYSPDLANEDFPIRSRDYLTWSGSGPQETVIDGMNDALIFSLESTNDVTIENMKINKHKGGVNAINSHVVINNCIIENGTDASAVQANASNVDVFSSLIRNNISTSGAGLYLNDDSHVYLKGTTIRENKGEIRGGGINIVDGTITFDTIDRCNIYLNSAKEQGFDIYTNNHIELVVDTFTYLNPEEPVIYPESEFEKIDILHGIIEQVSQNLYVSPEGSDLNSGLSEDEPLKSITTAILKILPDSANPLTIYLDDGVYSFETTGERFPFSLKEGLFIEGNNHHNTIIDGNGESRIFNLLHLTNTVISNLTLQNGYSSSNGGSIYMVSSSGTFNNLIIKNNQAEIGAGLYCSNSTPVISKVRFTGNTTTYYPQRGGGCYFLNSNPIITYCLFDNNSASHGGGLYSTGTDLSMSNSILHNNDASSGAGITIESSTAELYDVIIHNNQASNNGGGIFLWGSENEIYLSNSIIKNNYAINYGGGIYNPEGSDVSFNPLERCSVFNNEVGQGNGYYSWYSGHDIYSTNHIDLIIDTFSVESPRGYFFWPPENFTIDLLNSAEEHINADLYVSVNGADTNSGLSWEEPLLSIHEAINRIKENPEQPNTIHLGSGRYDAGMVPSNGLVPCDNILIKGIDPDSTVFDAVDIPNSLFTLYDLENIVLKNFSIKDSEAEKGAAFCSFSSSPMLESLKLFDNKADMGGALYFKNSSPYLSDVLIKGNRANVTGGGIYCDSATTITFDSINRCNMYNNIAYYDEHNKSGRDIFSCGPVHLVADTFSVLHPTSQQAAYISNFTYDIWHGYYDQTLADLYVSIAGSDTNSGISWSEPLRTVNKATTIIAANHLMPRTIYIDTGEYFFGIMITDYVTLQGAGREGTRLTGSTFFGHLNDSNINDLEIHGSLNSIAAKVTYNNVSFDNSTFASDHSEISILNSLVSRGTGIFTNSQLFISSSEVKENIGPDKGGAFYLEGSSGHFYNTAFVDNASKYGGVIYATHNSNINIIGSSFMHNTAHLEGGVLRLEDSEGEIVNSIFTGNYGARGGACYISKSNIEFTGNLFSGNYSQSLGGAIYTRQSNTRITNNTIAHNEAKHKGGGLYTTRNVTTVENSILYGNIPNQAEMYSFGIGDSLFVSYSDIQDGINGIDINIQGDLFWLEGNIEEDPMFNETLPHPHALQNSSPCINAGNPDTTGLALPENDLLGNQRIYGLGIDMGAYENQNVFVGEDEYVMSRGQLEVFPNPFGKTLNIQYSTLNTQYPNVIEILDNTGRIIYRKSTVNRQPSTVNWNGTNHYGDPVPPGVYTVLLKDSERILAKSKVVKL